MLGWISTILAKKLLQRANGNKYDEAVYIYGIELIISTIAGLSSILVISGLCGNVVVGVVFISTFVPLRLFTGGYHASTYGLCFAISNLSFLLLYVINNVIWDTIDSEILLGIFIIAILYIALNAPKINIMQNINRYKKKRCKKIVQVILGIESLWVICMVMFNQELMSISILSVCLVAFYMLITKNPIQKGVVEV